MEGNQVLYRQYRPQKFADLVNQDHVKQTLLNAIKLGKVGHAYLFAGPRGTGKTSMARLLAKAVNCSGNQEGEPCGQCQNCQALVAGRMLDLIEIDAASHTGVDDIRDLIERVNLTPAVGKYKVYIIDEAHMLSKYAFNALLKTLEEPPAHAIFILATTEVNKLLPTIVSRCQYFDFHYLPWQVTVDYLKQITSQEKISITDDALEMIAENAEGSLRDALSILDQVASLNVTQINRTELEHLLGLVDIRLIEELTGAVLSQNAVRGIELINQAYFKGYDLNQLSRQWMLYLRELMMISLGNIDLVKRSESEKQIMQQQVKQMQFNAVVNLLQRLVEANNQYKVASIPQLALEMVVLKSVSNQKPMVVPVPVIEQSPIQPSAPMAIKPTGEQAEFWSQVCQKIAVTNLALSSLLKNSQVKILSDKVVVELPSQFLKDFVIKPDNLQIINQHIGDFYGAGLPIEFVVMANNNPINQVAEVFDIM